MSDIANLSWPECVKVAAAERVLHAGAAVRVTSDDDALVCVAVETLRDATMRQVLENDHPPKLVLSSRRAMALGIEPTNSTAVVCDLQSGLKTSDLHALCDPTRPVKNRLNISVRPATELEAASVALCKIAGLLPAALLLNSPSEAVEIVGDVQAQTVTAYRDTAAASLERVTDAVVPLEEASKVRFVAFRSRLGGPQQYALVVGKPEQFAAPLCRLHSECFTGDLFGSLRCDCGQQLRGALRRMDEVGGGVILYLAQEGRGIGLVNKLRAYTLQDTGIDTVDANTHLGFEPDERDFLAAATMLRGLNINCVRLMTNNPDKVESLSQYGIDVVERVTHSFAANAHNAFYLETKARRAGHLIDITNANAKRAV